MDHDRNFKELLSEFFIEFVDLCSPEVAAEIDRGFAIVPLTQEVYGDLGLGGRSAVDLVMQARFRGRDAYFVVHVENQAKAQTEFPKRMFRYFTRLTEKFDKPVYPVVIFSYDKPLRQEPDTYAIKFSGKIIMRFQYKVIQLNRIPWREFAKRSNPVACALMAKMQMEPGDRPKVKLECLRLLATLKIDPARSKLIGGFIESYLKLTALELNEYEREFSQFAPIERKSTMALISSWEQRGIDRGLSQGKEQVLSRLIRKRFGEIPPSATGKLEALTSDQLNDLAESLLDFGSAADLERWLSRNLPA